MTQVDELQKKYPSIPRDMIIVAGIRRNGVRYTDVIDKVSMYDRGDTYQSRDFDLSIKDIARERPQAIKQGFVLRTVPMYLKSGFCAKVIRSTRSPYEIREEGPSKFALYEGEERIEDVYFPAPKHRWSDEPEKEPRTSKGNPVTSLVRLRRRCFGVNAVYHCEYFNTGDQCRFCNFNTTHQDAANTSQFRSITANLDETVEAYRIIASENLPLIEGRLGGGGFADSDREVGHHLQFVEQLASSTSYLPNIGLSTQPMSRQMLQRLKDAGLRSINMNIEVWDPQMFEEVCPGKAKNRGRDRYLEAYQDAVDILGWGSVGTNMPSGVTLMPENGHKTWHEALASQAEGLRWLIQHGVFPKFEGLVLGVSSVYGDNPANRDRLPPTDYLIELSIAHHEACMEYGMYERMNRLLWCPLCCQLNYAGELGMVTVAGDIGKWASTCLPEDANWLGQFIESFKTPTKSVS